MRQSEVKICDCGHALDLGSVLDAMPSGALGSSGMLYTRCGGCGKPLELRLADGRCESGYSYSSGSVHFEPVKTVRVAGLKIAASAPDDLDVTFGERHWHFSVTHVSTRRFMVFASAYAVGKRLCDLTFGRWNVSVDAVERAGARLESLDDCVLAAGDSLWLRGPAPALTTAWRYLNTGASRQAGPGE